MDKPRDKRIMSLVHACTDMTVQERAAFLSVECSGDGELRDAVLGILDEDAAATGVRSMPQHLTAALPEYYRLIELIGSGGMADVFLAEDTRLHRRVAIKFLNELFRADPERMLRFKQEARSASALNHPNIITIHDIGEANGVQYIVSEYVDGETLAARMTRGRLPLAEAIDTAILIASALDTSHQAGVVHRDLKPENIMLRRDGGLKVVDFGLAKGSAILGHRGETLEVVTTSPGMILGTPRYMSPEQTRGLPLDGRSDIFSFGIILFEMVTGRTPFPGTTAADTIAAILSKEPRDITDFIDDPPSKLVNIVRRCLNKNREERYRSMGAILSDLQELRMELVTAQIRPHATVAETRLRRSSRFVWLAAAIALVTIAAVAGWAWYGKGRSTVITTGALKNVTVTSWSTFSAENVTAAAFSPDTRMIAFGSTRSGSSEIWSKPVAGGEVIQVTKNGFYNQYPIWSADGQELAFYSKRGQGSGIWRVSFTGGQETEIVNGLSGLARPMRWLADGRLFVLDKDAIFVASTMNGDRRTVIDLGQMNLHPRATALSPDGSAIAISVKEADEWRLKYKALSDDAFRDLARSKEPIDSIAFHPGGTSIFYSGGVDGTQQVFETTTSGATPVQVSSGSTDVALQDVSAEGGKILCSSITETSDLWLVNADGKEQVVANDVTEEFWPDVSPDGHSVAYETMTQADRPFRGSIVVRQFDSAAPQTVAKEGFAPVWSPDGKWLAYYRRSNSGMSIMKVRPSGAEETKLADGQITTPGYYNTPYLLTSVSYISWSPDGTGVAYSSKVEPNWEIFLSPSDGSGGTKQLTSGDNLSSSPTPIWTGDGAGIIFSAEGGTPREYSLRIVPAGGGTERTVFRSKTSFQLIGNDDTKGIVLIAQKGDPADASPTPSETQIYAVSIDTGAAKLLSSLKKAYFSNIHLSRDGKNLAYVTRSDNVTELWTLPASGGAPKRLLSNNDPKVLISTLSWAADGRALIFGKQTRMNVLSMLTN